MPDRVEVLKTLLEQNPSDTFTRYALAMEYVRQGSLEQAAAEYRALIAKNPEYGPAYFQAGQTLEKLGRIDDARDLYREGVEVTRRQGNAHALSEMQAALDLLG